MEETFGSFYSTVYYVNSAIGAGFLVMPYVYQQAGLVLALICQFAVMFSIWLQGFLLLGVMARAQTLFDLKKLGIRPEPVAFGHLFGKRQFKNYRPLESSPLTEPVITSQRIDFCELPELVLGKTMHAIVMIGIVFGQLSWLISETIVFAETFAANMPLLASGTCDITDDGGGDWRLVYTLWGGLFALIMIVVTLVGYKEQRHFQIFMFWFRVGIMMLIAIWGIHLLATGKEIDDGGTENKFDKKLFDLNKLGMALSIMTGSAIFIIIVPTVSELTKNRLVNLPIANVAGSWILFTLFASMGLILGLSVSDINPIGSLAFSNYTGGKNEREWWSQAIGWIVVTCPALDLLSIFPLISISTSDQVQSLIWGQDPDHWGRVSFYTSRFLILIPTFAIALAVYKIDDILMFGGLMFILICFIILPWMSLHSKRLVPEKSQYDLRFGGNWIEIGMMVFGLFTVSMEGWWVCSETLLAVLRNCNFMKETFGTGYAAIYLVNSAIGCGILLLPWGFSRCGLVLSTIVTFFVTIQVGVISQLLLGAMSRYQVLSDLKGKGTKLEPLPFRWLFSDNYTSYRPIGTDCATERPYLTNQRIDLVSLPRIIYGRGPQIVYTIIYTLFMYTQNIMEIIAFGSQLASTVPITSYGTCNVFDDDSSEWRLAYSLWGLVFGVAISVIVLVGYQEQRKFQMVMFWERVFYVSVIVAACIHLIISGKEIDSDESERKGHAPLFNFMNIGMVSSIAIGGVTFANYLTEVSEATFEREKNLPRGIWLAAGILMMLCCTIGIFGAVAIENVSPLISLDFSNYSGGQSERQWWSYAIGYWVVLLPAMDLFSIYPLIAINNADSLQALFWGSESENWSRKSYYLSRFMVLIPTLTVALLFYDIGKLIIYTGILWVFIQSFGIPLISWEMKRLVPSASPYDIRWAQNYMELAVIGVGVVQFGLILEYIATNYAS